MRVVREGAQEPARVLVHSVADEFEGREEWVPLTRLKVPWDGVEACQAREARWKRVSAFGPGRGDPREYAVEVVFVDFVDRELARMNDNFGDLITISRPDEFAESFGLRIEQLTDYSEAFWDEGILIEPWPATELVAQAVARLNAEQRASAS